MLHKTVTQNCNTKLLQEAVTRSCYTNLLYEAVIRSCYMKLLAESVTQNCYTKLLHEDVTRKCYFYSKTSPQWRRHRNFSRTHETNLSYEDFFHEKSLFLLKSLEPSLFLGMLPSFGRGVIVTRIYCHPSWIFLIVKIPKGQIQRRFTILELRTPACTFW